jgi:putative SOS response-associated peptidase YedK
MTWGWARDFATGGKLINARAEGIAGKRTFAEAVQRRRCLVPATAWFEWRKSDPGARGGVKHGLRPDGLETWAIAGVWEPGQLGASVVLLTTAAHPSIAAIHDRMPVIIAAEQGSRWLRAGVDDALGLAVASAASAQTT